MRSRLSDKLERCRLRTQPAGDAHNGIFEIEHHGARLRCVVSDGMGWEHVSVSIRGRLPTWEEMCHVKRLFWGDEETVIEFHPPRSEYVNFHRGVLHLWRPIGVALPRPPSILVGPREMDAEPDRAIIGEG